MNRAMPSRPRKPSDANPRAVASRSWRASLIRSKGQVLGDVEAPNREAAEAEAVRTFNLTAEQRNRLVVQERGYEKSPGSGTFGVFARAPQSGRGDWPDRK
jgi:hypothetical protein